jgi:hypothetical protein
MPVDPYRPFMEHFTASSHIFNLLEKSCMESAGFEFPVVSYFPRAAPPATENVYGRLLFSRAIAAQVGYRPAPDPTTRSSEAQAVTTFVNEQGEKVQGYDVQLEKCIKETNKKYKPKIYELQMASGLGMDADDAALESPVVKAAMSRWRDCMAPMGISDLPQIPFYMPSQSVTDRFGLEHELAPIWNRGIPASAEEIDLAVFDAECQTSSGFEKAWYDANWNAQLSLIEKHADELERVRAAIAADWADVQRRLAAAEQPH